WQRKKKTDSFNENVLLVYFHELSKTLKPPTLWSRWSMLRTTINLRNGIDINNYHNLKVFIKNCAKGYHSKKARVLTLSQVILTFGVLGALRTSEICNLNIQDVEDTGSQMIATINDNKNCYPRNFVNGKEYYGHVKKYIALRPDDFDSRRFFFAYHSGKGKRQIIGKNKISKVPIKVAEYLELEHPEAYTGHCFRRTVATLLANSGANLTAVKQLGGWRSSTTAEGYIEHSLANRRQIYQQIISSHQEISPRSTSNCQVPSATITNKAPSTSTANQNNPKTNL
ncbi:GSCOCG00011016001-RA-CDS, partial [Cotesia congregata]